MIDTILFRIFVPGEKVAKFEATVARFKEEMKAKAVQEATYRAMASLVGKYMSFGPAIPAVRAFTMQTYNCIRPVGHDFDAVGQVSPEMMEEVTEMVQYIRPLNTQGAPIRRKSKVHTIRLISDASTRGKGFRLDSGTRDIMWSKHSLAVASDWVGDPEEQQAWRELKAVDEALDLLPAAVCNCGLLLWLDDTAAVAYINAGSGPSKVMTAIIKDIRKKAFAKGLNMY